MRALLLWCAIGVAAFAGCGDDGAPISPTCADGVQNGGESGVDCGGGVCGTCAEGGGCIQHGDCESGVCGDDGACVAQSCTDGLHNADETDVDCGGGCDACSAGASCDDDGDCQSGRCDDGTCAGAACGDGIVNGDEACDDGGESANCNADCTAVSCGDLVVNNAAGETCDEGGEATATCDADCTLRSCGDSTANTDAGEVCDTGGNSATCDRDCTAPLCGDGLLNTAVDEVCDDAGDSLRCDMDCSPAECGDDYVNAAAGEDCEEGAVDTGTCDFDCTAAVCGDAYLNETAGEACDTGTDTATCDSGDCTAAVCGDGYTNAAAGEDCDDGGTEPGDGCSSECENEGMVAISPFFGDLYRLNPFTYQTEATVPLTAPGETITGANGIAKHPTTDVVYVAVKVVGAGRSLGTLDTATGAVTLIGDMGDSVAGLAFSDDGTLYAVTGDGANTPETLWTVDLGTGALTAVRTFGNGDDGEVIAMRPGDARIFHWSGLAGTEEIYEVYDPDAGTITNLVTDYGVEQDEVFGAFWSPVDDAFVVFDINLQVLLNSVDGTITDTGFRTEVNLKGAVLTGDVPPIVSPLAIGGETVDDQPEPEPALPERAARKQGQLGGCSVGGASGAASALLLALLALAGRRRRT